MQRLWAPWRMQYLEASGVGVADHCHWHLLPRWNGDTNFMPVIGDVRVMSEHLQATLERVRAHYA